MKKVILVGTKHSIQRGENPDFGSYVKSLVAKYSPLAIAEELERCPSSVANAIAISCGLPHLIIEPTPTERKQLGILSSNKILFNISMELDGTDSLEARKEYTIRNENSYRARERQWLKRLNDLNNWPVLVICGSAHFHPFVKLLKENSIEVVAENESWE